MNRGRRTGLSYRAAAELPERGLWGREKCPNTATVPQTLVVRNGRRRRGIRLWDSVGDYGATSSRYGCNHATHKH
ncbi:hypothetical protein FRUB_07697 [Fimbriiglobus ruber]|uniref:Uncharacterized protein n=1 Tax=Fimbriiglobus ruber TaxID=1908690 RepID=A0A225DR10_9BACT|nr:hypothetical protein FRUB_07697 [Fimbriiglobus ruber]